MHFESTGAEVPAFDLHFAMPLVLRLTVPREPAGADMVVSRSQDLQLVWDRGAPDIDFYFEALKVGAGMGVLATCRFDSAMGSAVVSKEVMADFDSASFVRVYTAHHMRTRIGIFDTEVIILTSVHYPPPDSRVVSLKFE